VHVQVVVGEIDADMISKYTVLAAVYCLLRYVENTVGSVFCQNSLRSAGEEGLVLHARRSARKKRGRGMSLAPPPTLLPLTIGVIGCARRLQHGSGGRERMLMDGKTACNLEVISNLCR
jgi:hypothetical protein